MPAAVWAAALPCAFPLCRQSEALAAPVPKREGAEIFSVDLSCVILIVMIVCQTQDFFSCSCKSEAREAQHYLYTYIFSGVFLALSS